MRVWLNNTLLKITKQLSVSGLHPSVCLYICLYVSGKKRRKTRGDHFKQRFRKNFTTLLEEEVPVCLSFCLIKPNEIRISSRHIICSIMNHGSDRLYLPIGRIYLRGRSQTTCRQRLLPRPSPPAPSAPPVASRPTTPAAPVEGDTAAHAACSHTERPGLYTLSTKYTHWTHTVHTMHSLDTLCMLPAHTQTRSTHNIHYAHTVATLYALSTIHYLHYAQALHTLSTIQLHFSFHNHNLTMETGCLSVPRCLKWTL